MAAEQKPTTLKEELTRRAQDKDLVRMALEQERLLIEEALRFETARTSKVATNIGTTLALAAGLVTLYVTGITEAPSEPWTTLPQFWRIAVAALAVVAFAAICATAVLCLYALKSVRGDVTKVQTTSFREWLKEPVVTTDRLYYSVTNQFRKLCIDDREVNNRRTNLLDWAHISLIASIGAAVVGAAIVLAGQVI